MSISSSICADVGWYKAATLSERVKLRREASAPLPSVHDATAPKRWRRWRSQAPFTKDGFFSRRLEALEIGEDEFLAVLGESAAVIRDRNSTFPAWLERLGEVFSDSTSHNLPFLQQQTRESFLGLLNVASPLLNRALSKLRGAIAGISAKDSHAPLTVEMVERVFLDALVPQLLAIVGKVAVLELNVARVEGSLDGETQQDRYRSFIQHLAKHEAALALLGEYPVMARQLVIGIDQCLDSIVEFVDRMCSDWALILHSLAPGGAEPGPLVHVSVAGDRHRGGRCVLIATFSSGFKLVYKPKSLAVDKHFQVFLSWINARGHHPPLPTLKVLDRGIYGWSEFVAAESCHSKAELRRFYQRQGAYLAVLYLLEATDFHSENIIASGEHPVLIDLEAILHPRLKGTEQSEDADITALSHSVFRVGLLPWQSEQSCGIDLSGLGGASGQFTPDKIPYWELAGTDEMRLARRKMPIQSGGNRPSINHLEVGPSDYLAEITAGFTGVYQLFMKFREDLLSDDGPLNMFANDEVRVILRPTKTYGVLLNESFHPDVMRDALDRDLLFDRLWMAVEAFPYLARVISSECEDLQRCDIPFFSTRPNCLDIYSSTRSCISGLIEQPSLSMVKQRLSDLNERSLKLQCWLIRASLAANSTTHSPVDSRRRQNIDPSPTTADTVRVLNAACTVGDRLASSAILWNESASWIGLTAATEGQWNIAASMLDLYDGLPGIALFLAYLGRTSGRAAYSDLARKTCNTMIRRVEKYKSADVCIGGFAGWGGVVYALTHLSILWDDSGLLARAHDIAQLLCLRASDDIYFDVIAGSAGCIASLLALYRHRKSPRILGAAIACGDNLIARSTEMPDGVGWIIPEQTTPLSGFAHGAAGIAWALFQLAELSGEDRFSKAAEAAISHERTLFDAETANWRDLRTWKGERDIPGKPPMSAWCHGAAGIGMARLATLNQFDNDQVRQEIDIALHTTLKEGFGGNDSLCHGGLGNMELVLQAGRVLKDERWSREAHRIGDGIAQNILRDQYRCGTPLHVDSPGLMTGLAGIGYGLLRLAAPESVPSVLTLQAAE